MAAPRVPKVTEWRDAAPVNGTADVDVGAAMTVPTDTPTELKVVEGLAGTPAA